MNTPTYNVVTTCRMCGGTDLEVGLMLPATPFANAYEHPAVQFRPGAPLTVMVCGTCGHSQLREHVSGSTLFANYLYTSGTSATLVKHFTEQAKAVKTRLREVFGEQGMSLSNPLFRVLEIGSNDGTLLHALEEEHIHAEGIEPAKNLVAKCTADHLTAEASMFDLEYARRHVLEGRPLFHAVVANNVLAHVDSLVETMQALDLVLHEDGFLMLEVQYQPKLIEMNAWDLVYHEHCDYHRVGPWQALMGRFGFGLVEARPITTHGGSIRLVFRRGGEMYSATSAQNERQLIYERLSRGEVSHPLIEWRMLQGKVQGAALDLRAKLAPFKKVAVYGCPAKLTTLMYGLGIVQDARLLSKFCFVVDDASTKQGLWTPGGHLRITNGRELQLAAPDAVLLGAWNLKDELVPKIRALVPGAPIIIPFPNVEVL